MLHGPYLPYAGIRLLVWSTDSYLIFSCLCCTWNAIVLLISTHHWTMNICLFYQLHWNTEAQAGWHCGLFKQRQLFFFFLKERLLNRKCLVLLYWAEKCLPLFSSVSKVHFPFFYFINSPWNSSCSVKMRTKATCCSNIHNSTKVVKALTLFIIKGMWRKKIRSLKVQGQSIKVI